jgi:DNA topoisomerase-1
MLNTHLKEIMDGLTAKVFRTYNASKTLQDELMKTEAVRSFHSLTPAEKVVEYNNANREVAILCNHQKSVSKAQTTQLETIGSKLAMLKKQKSVLKKMFKIVYNGADKKIPTKKSEDKMVEAAQKAIERAKKMKDKAVTNEEKIAATEADEKAKQQRRDAQDMKFTQAHLWDKQPTADQIAKRIKMWTSKISKMELNLKHKDDNKEVSLGTSKVRLHHTVFHDEREFLETRVSSFLIHWNLFLFSRV